MRTPLQVRRPSKEAAILWCATCGEVAPRANRLGDSCPFGHPYEQNTRTRDTLVPAYGVSEFGLEWQRAIGLAADATSYRYIGLNLPAAIALVIEYEAAGAFIIDGANDCGVDVVVVGHHELALAQVKANASISASAEVVQRLRGSRLILGSGAEAASVLTDLVRPDRDKLTGELFETMSRALAVDAARNPIAISFKGWSDTKDTLASVPVTRWDWHNIAAVISGAGHAIPQSFADWVALAFDYDVVATRGALTKVVGRRSAPVLAH